MPTEKALKIWNELETTKPQFKPSSYLFTKFLGCYISLEDGEPKVHDLYVAEGSKFHSKFRSRVRPKYFVAVYGNSKDDYYCNDEQTLSALSNEDLKQTATGEAYRRYKHRVAYRGF